MCYTWDLSSPFFFSNDNSRFIEHTLWTWILCFNLTSRRANADHFRDSNRFEPMAPKSMASNRVAWLKAKGCTRSQAAETLLLEFPYLSSSRRCQLLAAYYSGTQIRQGPTHESASCIASFLTSDAAIGLLGANVRRVALSAKALNDTCSMWRSLLRPALDVLHQNYNWQKQVGPRVASYLLAYHYEGESSRRPEQQNAALLMPLYCTCEGWRSILIDLMDSLYFNDVLDRWNGLAMLNAMNNKQVGGRWNARLVGLA